MYSATSWWQILPIDAWKMSETKKWAVYAVNLQSVMNSRVPLADGSHLEKMDRPKTSLPEILFVFSEQRIRG